MKCAFVGFKELLAVYLTVCRTGVILQKYILNHTQAPRLDVPTAYDSFLNPGTLVWLSGESAEKGTRDLKRAQTLCSLLIQACSTKSRMTQRSERVQNPDCVIMPLFPGIPCNTRLLINRKVASGYHQNHCLSDCIFFFGTEDINVVWVVVYSELNNLLSVTV